MKRFAAMLMMFMVALVSFASSPEPLNFDRSDGVKQVVLPTEVNENIIDMVSIETVETVYMITPVVSVGDFEKSEKTSKYKDFGILSYANRFIPSTDFTYLEYPDSYLETYYSYTETYTDYKPIYNRIKVEQDLFEYSALRENWSNSYNYLC